MMVKEMLIGVGSPVASIAQGPMTKEQVWNAILATEGPTPPGEFKFPWWLVGVIGAGVVAVAIKKQVRKA